MDPLPIIFIPGGLTAAALVFGAPAATTAYLAWRWRARRRVGKGACGRCARPFADDGERFLATGVLICEPCARTLRRRLRLALPLIAICASVFAVTSGSAFVLSLLRGGPHLRWWLDGRWIPLLLPSVGVGLIAWGTIAVGKRSNRLAASTAGAYLSTPTDSTEASVPHGV